jgi:hypothetical protein
MKFQTGSKNDEKLNAWLQVHVLSCEAWDVTKPSELPLVTYTFTPTPTGLIIRVNCGCGETEDITDYDEWR